MCSWINTQQRTMAGDTLLSRKHFSSLGAWVILMIFTVKFMTCFVYPACATESLKHSSLDHFWPPTAKPGNVSEGRDLSVTDFLSRRNEERGSQSLTTVTETHQNFTESHNLSSYRTSTTSNDLSNIEDSEGGILKVPVGDDGRTQGIDAGESWRSLDTLSSKLSDFGYLSLTPDDVMLCFGRGSLLRFNASGGFISFHNAGDESKATRSASCRIHVTVPEHLVVLTQFLNTSTTCEQVNVTLRDAEPGRYRHLVTACGNSPQDDVSSYTNNVVFLLKVTERFEHPFSFTFTSVVKPELELHHTSATSGYIQTPGWDGVASYPLTMDSTVQVDVPEGHTLMISYPSMDVDRTRLDAEMEAGGHEHCSSIENVHVTFENEARATFTCRRSRRAPKLYHSKWFRVTFRSDSTQDGSTGFRVLFTLHNATAQPEQLPGGMWNCSARHWYDFRQHFPCDLSRDCAGGEDEADCPYTSPSCGRDQLAVNGRCFKFLPYRVVSIQWPTVDKACQIHGGRLPIFISEKKLKDLVWLLQWMRTEPGVARHLCIGLRDAGAHLPHIYRDLLQWSDGTIAYSHPRRTNDEVQGKFLLNTLCGVLTITGDLQLFRCVMRQQVQILCEVDKDDDDDKGDVDTDAGRPSASWVHFPTVSFSQWDTPGIIQCPDKHWTHLFLACDVKSRCWGSGYGSFYACRAPLTSLPPLYTCASGKEYVSYTFLCDYRPDCTDKSDEDFCVFPRCLEEEFDCGNKQCVAVDKICDGHPDCVNVMDEITCYEIPEKFNKTGRLSRPPLIVDLDRRETLTTFTWNVWREGLEQRNLSCPETHFQCLHDDYCLPVYLRCNGAYDCPGHEDEEGCEGFTCPGFYRCRGSKICLHPRQVCDGVAQCPQRDDELVCDLVCPEQCRCYGLAFVCSMMFPAEDFPQLRFLDASGTGMSLSGVSRNIMLVDLNLAECGLSHVHNVSLPNLVSLNLRDNHITALEFDLVLLSSNLKTLLLAGNPLASFFSDDSTMQLSWPALETLDISRITLPELNVAILAVFPKLRALNMSECRTERLLGNGFRSLSNLRILDIRGCPLRFFPRGIFHGLDQLSSVSADNYKLCCPDTLPAGFHAPNCKAPADEISSCEALLRSDFYRVVLSVFAVLALAGNVGSFGYRVFFHGNSNKQGFSVFVTHLCLSDFLMGVYLAIIGISDHVYRGTYLWKEAMWTSSTACKVAGFLSLLSSEVSAITICLITADRFTVLRFPFSSIRFGRWSAHLACAVTWTLGLTLAAVPLLPGAWHWEFYSQTGICIPLPITRNSFPGHTYSFSVLIVLNFVLFVTIAVGQIFVFWSIRSNSMSTSSTASKTKDLTIARRLITVAVSDFLCWFPIGLLGFLAQAGTPIPGEVNVAMAIIALPLNSALNPFLYTVNMVLEKRRRNRETKIFKQCSISLKQSPRVLMSSQETPVE